MLEKNQTREVLTTRSVPLHMPRGAALTLLRRAVVLTGWICDTGSEQVLYLDDELMLYTRPVVDAPVNRCDCGTCKRCKTRRAVYAHRAKRASAGRIAPAAQAFLRMDLDYQGPPLHGPTT